jgi:hypothetical protein
VKPDERGFEDAITGSLVEAGGYRVCKWGTKAEWVRDFDPRLGLDTAELLAFIEETQPVAWARLFEVHDGRDGLLRQFGDRLAKQLDERGSVDVLRHGVSDHGVEVRLAFFKPAHGLTPELNARYLANRLTVTRQLPYEAGSTKTLDHGQVYSLLAPAMARFEATSDDAQDETQALLDQFTRAYSFLSQVVDFADVSLEALYLASRALILLLAPAEGGGRLDLGAEVELTHLRLEQTSQGSISPERGIGELSSIYSGAGKQADAEKERLSRIIDVVNERFGLQLGTADQLFFDQLEETWAADEALVAQARANDLSNFRLPFKEQFEPHREVDEVRQPDFHVIVAS